MPCSGAPRLGIGYEVLAVGALAATVGLPAAMDLLLTARKLDAGEARRIGLVHAVCPRAELADLVREQAERLAANAPLTLRAFKLAARERRKSEASRRLPRGRRHVPREAGATLRGALTERAATDFHRPSTP